MKLVPTSRANLHNKLDESLIRWESPLAFRRFFRRPFSTRIRASPARPREKIVADPSDTNYNSNLREKG